MEQLRASPLSCGSFSIGPSFSPYETKKKDLSHMYMSGLIQFLCEQLSRKIENASHSQSLMYQLISRSPRPGTFSKAVKSRFLKQIFGSNSGGRASLGPLILINFTLFHHFQDLNHLFTHVMISTNS